ncbi:MAG: chorismate mutase [Firmicutes bacterium]|nr:chorismate mutase [Bacillota bacterium]
MSKESLKDIRVKIDAVDKQMMELFKERMALSQEVALIKRDNNISLIDPPAKHRSSKQPSISPVRN